MVFYDMKNFKSLVQNKDLKCIYYNISANILIYKKCHGNIGIIMKSIFKNRFLFLKRNRKFAILILQKYNNSMKVNKLHIL
jgi:hypothetical protein